MLIGAQRYLEIHDRRVSEGGGFVISTQLESQAPGVKRWPVWPDYDRVLGGLFLRPCRLLLLFGNVCCSSVAAAQMKGRG